MVTSTPVGGEVDEGLGLHEAVSRIERAVGMLIQRLDSADANVSRLAGQVSALTQAVAAAASMPAQPAPLPPPPPQPQTQGIAQARAQGAPLPAQRTQEGGRAAFCDCSCGCWRNYRGRTALTCCACPNNRYPGQQCGCQGREGERLMQVGNRWRWMPGTMPVPPPAPEPIDPDDLPF